MPGLKHFARLKHSLMRIPERGVKSKILKLYTFLGSQLFIGDSLKLLKYCNNGRNGMAETRKYFYRNDMISLTLLGL